MSGTSQVGPYNSFDQGFCEGVACEIVLERGIAQRIRTVVCENAREEQQ